jgi:hypothetical protein
MAGPRVGAHNKARIVGVVGASGTGKGCYIKTVILPACSGPAMVWSPLESSDNYAEILGVRATASIPELIEAWKARRSAVYQPPMNPKLITSRFDLFCRAVWHMTGAAVVVEELSRVTTASYAPPSWKNLSTAGRHQGLTLIGACQRPSQVDKDFFGNCTEIRCFRVNYENDAKTMAQVLRVKPGDLLELPDLHYIHRMLATRENSAGILTPPQKKPAAPVRKKAAKNL